MRGHERGDRNPSVALPLLCCHSAFAFSQPFILVLYRVFEGGARGLHLRGGYNLQLGFKTGTVRYGPNDAELFQLVSLQHTELNGI